MITHKSLKPAPVFKERDLRKPVSSKDTFGYIEENGHPVTVIRISDNRIVSGVWIRPQLVSHLIASLG